MAGEDGSAKKSMILTAVISIILAGGLTMGLFWVLLNVKWVQKHFETVVEVVNETFYNQWEMLSDNFTQLLNTSTDCLNSLKWYQEVCQKLKRMGLPCEDVMEW
jgi:hypothetical protein